MEAVGVRKTLITSQTNETHNTDLHRTFDSDTLLRFLCIAENIWYSLMNSVWAQKLQILSSLQAAPQRPDVIYLIKNVKNKFSA